MNSPVEQIKERLNIVDVISSYVKVEKAGANYRARCPFHNEKTPSFFISPARGNFHCFGCSKGGDIFTFVEDIEGIDFANALKILAERAGVTLDRGNVNQKSERSPVYGVMEATVKFYRENLAKNVEALNYLKHRGLSIESVNKWQIGFAPDGWRNTVSYLLRLGYSLEAIDRAGLVIESRSQTKPSNNIEEQYYDRFRSRIMFPISDSQGRVVAFTGRIFGYTQNEKEIAKYINSPETELYNKSRILFGYDKAKRAIMSENLCVLVEGQMDLIMAHQAGTENAVAVSGTALTVEHLGLIKRFTENLILSFDADPAGLKAGNRGVDLAIANEMQVKVVKIPDGLDPADLILKDKTEWLKSLSEAKNIIGFLLDYFGEKSKDKEELKNNVDKIVIPKIAQMPNKINQAFYAKMVAEKLFLSEESINARILTEEEKIKKSENVIFKQIDTKVSEIPNMRKAVVDSFAGLYLWQKGRENPELDFSIVEKRYKDITKQNMAELLENYTDAIKGNLVFKAEAYYEGHKNVNFDADELLDNLEKDILDEKLQKYMMDLKKAEAEGQADHAMIILAECNGISKRISEIKSKRFLSG